MTDFRLPTIGQTNWGDEVIDSLTNLNERTVALEGGSANGVLTVNGDPGPDVVLDAADVSARPASYVPDYGDITGKPSTFPPSSHAHLVSEISNITNVGTSGQVLTRGASDYSFATPPTGVTDHGALTGLGDDDHTQYHNDARGDVRYYTKAQVDTQITDTEALIPADLGDLTGTVSAAQVSVGGSLYVYKAAGVWPSRPTNRTDLTVTWVGAAPAPSSGYPGGIVNVDIFYAITA